MEGHDDGGAGGAHLRHLLAAFLRAGAGAAPRAGRPRSAVGNSRVVLDVTDYYSLRKCSVVRQSWTGNGFVISGREKGKMKKIPFIGK